MLFLLLEDLQKKKQLMEFLKNELNKFFDRFWIDEINLVKADENGINHNKLRFYAKLKSSFSREPYLDLVQSRNQR